MYYVKVFFKFICEDKCLLQISLKIALNISILPSVESYHSTSHEYRE